MVNGIVILTIQHLSRKLDSGQIYQIFFTMYGVTSNKIHIIHMCLINIITELSMMKN